MTDFRNIHSLISCRLHFKPEKQSASRSPSPGGDSLEPNYVIPCDVTCTDSDLFTEPLHMDLTVLPLSLSCGPVLCDADDGADQDKEKAEGEEEGKGSGGLRDEGKLPEVERQPTLNGPASVDMTESSSYSIPVVTPQLPDVILSHSVPSSKPLASITARLPDCKPIAFIPSDQKLVKRWGTMFFLCLLPWFMHPLIMHLPISLYYHACIRNDASCRCCAYCSISIAVIYSCQHAALPYF